MHDSKRSMTHVFAAGLWAMGLIATLLAGSASAQGILVPVRPDIRVGGQWATKYLHADIRVRDQVASVTTDQKFENLSRGGMIEVEYFFPVPRDTAIDSMTLIVNGKEFAAKLLKADEARKIYEEIVRRKKDPALLEYVGQNLYRTRAFPLLPGKPARVQVTYKTLCKKDGSLLKVWYPLNTEKYSARKIEEVRVTVDIKSKADLAAAYSPSHDLHVKRINAKHVIATYEAKGVLPTADVQVFVEEPVGAIGASLLTSRPVNGKKGYFLMLVSPNPAVKELAHVQPKDVVVVFDHSGSMVGAKMRQTRAAVQYVLKNLNAADRFNVVPYNDAVESIFAKMREASPKNVASALDEIDRIDASGGTNIDEALQIAFGLLGKGKSRRPRYVLFLTDGQPTVGETDVKTILKNAQSRNKTHARLFAFGVGYDVNVPLLDKLVAQHAGRSDYVKPKESVETKIASLCNKIRHPVMTGLTVELRGVKLRDMYPRTLDDLFVGDQLVLTGRFDPREVKKLPRASKGKRVTQLIVKGFYRGKERAFEYPVEIAVKRSKGYEFIDKIWAIRRVGYLMDQVQLHGKNQEIVDELIRLSQQYGIMTPYTSFLADEGTALHRPAAVRERAGRNLDLLAEAESGEHAQRGSSMRNDMKKARNAPMPTATTPGASGDVAVFGNSSQGAYEKGKKETVRNVRQVGNQAIYQRGKLWVAANATKLDPEKDKAKIQDVTRFSPDYFKLVRANTEAENAIFASQQPAEELLITLRGQAYRIR